MTLELETESYIVFTRSAVLMGMSAQEGTRVVNGTLLDKGSNIIPSVRLPVLPAMRGVNMKIFKGMKGSRRKRLNTTGM